jgi:hypothetical protein
MLLETFKTMNTYLRLAATIILLMALQAVMHAQQVTLYDNDFESPNIPPEPNCGADLDATDLNTLWTGTAGGTGGGGSFQQVNSVETILINGPNGRYEDPSGTGGDYCISMLSVSQDDKAALTLNSQLLPFCIVSLDISAIDLDACGGPYGLDTPVMNIKIYDSPGGVFSFGSPGTLLDEDTISGTAPGATIFTFNWKNAIVSMDIDNSADGNITVVFDLWRSGYAAIDNLSIISSITGINQEDAHDEIMVVPNPVVDHFQLAGLSGADAHILITDMCGAVFCMLDYRPNQSIDVASLPAGNYLIAIRGKQTCVRKLIVL